MWSKQKSLYSLTLASIVASLLVLSGCETVNSGFGGLVDLDTNVSLTINVEADINPDERGTPSPLHMRFYQLKDKKMFERADFVQLYEQDEEAIGAEFVSRQKLKLIKPGVSRKEKFVLEKDTKFIGLYAEFFKYKDSKYKIVIPVTTANVIRNAVTIRVSGNRIALIED